MASTGPRWSAGSTVHPSTPAPALRSAGRLTRAIELSSTFANFSGLAAGAQGERPRCLGEGVCPYYAHRLSGFGPPIQPPSGGRSESGADQLTQRAAHFREPLLVAGSRENPVNPEPAPDHGDGVGEG